MSNVFVSYSHKDRERVRPIVAQLEAQGLSVWWDRNVVPGQKWEEEINFHLKDCRAVLVVWTKNSVDSDWVQKEADAGLQIDALVSIQLDEHSIAPLPRSFDHIHAADLVFWQGDSINSEFQSVLRALQALVSRPDTAQSLENTHLPFQLTLGGDLGSTDPRDLMWIQSKVQELGRNAAPVLLAALSLPEPNRRGHAAYLLGLTRDRTVVKKLVPLLADRQELSMGVNWMPTVRASAALALKTIGTREALQALADAFE